MVNIGKGESLDIIMHGLTQISGKSGSCARGKKAAHHAGCKAKQGYHDHQSARAHYKTDISRHYSAIHNLSHQNGNDHLTDNFSDHTDRSENRDQTKFLYLCQDCFDHIKHHFPGVLLYSAIEILICKVSRSLFRNRPQICRIDKKHIYL